MQDSLKKSIVSLRVGMVIAAAASTLLFSQPSYAGYWGLTGTMTGGYNSGNWGGSPNATYGQSSMSYFQFGGQNNVPLVGSFSYTGTVRWVPNGSLSTDPAPATVTVSETSAVDATNLYAWGTTAASDGLGDPGVTTRTSGYPGPSQTTTSSGSRTSVVSVAPGGNYVFTRNFSNSASGATLNEGRINYSASVK